LILGLIGKMFDSGRFNPTIPKTKTLFLCPCYFEVWLILDLVGWLVGCLVEGNSFNHHQMADVVCVF
jgi:hypothetical protein